jgi:hypothetical protein
MRFVYGHVRPLIVSHENDHGKGRPYPSAEIARNFVSMCERGMLHSGPVGTNEVELLASELVPEALARLCEPERLAA